MTLSAQLTSGQPEAPVANGYCSASVGSTQYFSAVFSAPFEKDPRGADPTYHTSVTWGRAFSDHVAQKFGDKAAAGSCSLQPAIAQAQTARTRAIEFTRQRMLKAVEVDWAPASATPESATPPSPAPVASNARPCESGKSA